MPINHPSEIHDTFMNAVNAQDVEGLLAMYDTGGIAVQLDGGECSGSDAMRAMFADLTRSISTIEGATRKVLVSDDVALSSAAWTAEISLPDGSIITQHGTTAEVSRRQPDGTWRVVIDDPTFV